MDYSGPDAAIENTTAVPQESLVQEAQSEADVNDTGEEYQTITLEELIELMQQDVNLRSQIAEQLGIETDDPQVIVQALVNQHHAAG